MQRTPHPSNELTKTAKEDGHADASIMNSDPTGLEVVQRENKDRSSSGEKTTKERRRSVDSMLIGKGRCSQRSRVGNDPLLGWCGVGICVGNESRNTSSPTASGALVVVVERPLLQRNIAHDDNR